MTDRLVSHSSIFIFLSCTCKNVFFISRLNLNYDEILKIKFREIIGIFMTFLIFF
jgi:hypothetical protein